MLIIFAVSPDPQKTFFTNVKPSLAAPLFTADLYHDQPGTFDFGTIDSTKYSGSITYVPVNNSQGFWGVTSSSYGIGSSSDMVKKNIDAIVDTGTTLLLVPQEVLDAYYKKVKGSKNSDADGGYIFPCDATLPDFYIGLGNYTAMVPASAINTGPADGDSKSSNPLQESVSATKKSIRICTDKENYRLLWWHPVLRSQQRPRRHLWRCLLEILLCGLPISRRRTAHDWLCRKGRSQLDRHAYFFFAFLCAHFVSLWRQ